MEPAEEVKGMFSHDGHCLTSHALATTCAGRRYVLRDGKREYIMVKVYCTHIREVKQSLSNI